MGYQNISLIRVRSHFFQRCPDRIRIGDNLLIREVFSYLSRLHKRQKIQIHRARRILQHEGIHMAVIHRSDMDSTSVHQAASEGKPLRGIVIAANDEDLAVSLGKPVKVLVKELYCFR